MNIALIGSGGRENALCRKLKESKNINQIFCIPGNAGTAKIATNLDIDFLDFKLLLKNLNDNKTEKLLKFINSKNPNICDSIEMKTSKKTRTNMNEVSIKEVEIKKECNKNTFVKFGDKESCFY